MCELAPSIYAADYLELKKQIASIKNGGANYLHIDIMDGHFVPSISFGPGLVAALRADTDLILDVHLMIESPGKFIQDFLKAGADIITVHAEISDNITALLDEIHAQGKKAGIVLKPETPVEEIGEELWERIDVIQIMTVEPGLSGQTFLPSSYNKIRKAKEKIKEQLKKNSKRIIDLEVDGDITSHNLEKVLLAGANIIVVGKGLFSGSLSANIEAYMEILRNGGNHAVSDRN